MGVVDRLEHCGIHKEEFLLLKALVLTNSDVRIQDTQALLRLRQNILQAIHDAIGTIRYDINKSFNKNLLEIRMNISVSELENPLGIICSRCCCACLRYGQLILA